MKRKQKHVCKYCGSPTTALEMCDNCKIKLQLIRKIFKMLEPYKKARVNNEN